MGHTVRMIYLIGLMRAVLVAAGREKPKDAKVECSEQSCRAAIERKIIDEVMARYERDRAISRANRD